MKHAPSTKSGNTIKFFFIFSLSILTVINLFTIHYKQGSLSLNKDLLSWLDECHSNSIESLSNEKELLTAISIFDLSIINGKSEKTRSFLDTTFNAKLTTDIIKATGKKPSKTWILNVTRISNDEREIIVLNRIYTWNPEPGVSTTPLEFYREVWHQDKDKLWKIFESGPWVYNAVDSVYSIQGRP